MNILLNSTSLILQGTLSHQILQMVPIILVTIVILVFLIVIVYNRIILQRIRRASRLSRQTSNLMQQALKSCETNVIMYDPAKDYTFKLYGHMIPDRGITSDEWKAHVHPDDLPDALHSIRQVISGKEKEKEFNYRWNFNFEEGEPRWGYLHNYSIGEYVSGISRPNVVISTLVDETELMLQQEKEEELTEKYKLIFENSIIGLSFYSADGWLIDANKKMRELCHFDSDDYDTYFSNTNLFDATPFHENVDRNHVEEFWVCSKNDYNDLHVYLEIRLHPIHDKNGKLTYIAIAIRDISEERDLYLQSKLNDEQIKKANEDIQRYEMELQYMMEAIDMRAWRIDYQEKKVQFMKGLSEIVKELTFDEYITYFIGDDQLDVAKKLTEPELYFTTPMSILRNMRPLFHSTDEVQWNQINSLPIFNDEGKLIGAFGLIRNMTRFYKAQELLKQETQRAIESGRLKSVFLANMTHEIRTPLNAIVGFSDLLQMMTTAEEKKEIIHVIHNNCDMLLRLINDIMAISSMDANGLIMKPADVDFAKAFNDICQTLAQRVENPNVQFIKENPYQTLQTRLDMGRITQVITNFVTNAVKYTQNGHIKVGYRIQDNGIYMYCEDTGTGIPKEKCPQVFERFVKLNDYVQGTGLGLSICKAIAERCNGKIGVDSEVGQGSTFWMWIPCVINNQEIINN
ncbi:PAS domain-containing sensor histidine kinase [Prevotella sp. tf2-5]|uniref:PAS domain-containing sensor histidine kinase n=1 Tax=Prevotella sp. tf2-5 TaxID=1761889 RepID=UPI0008E20A01|nr:PAS domain-containing sensor histidine kinase [Prevotella sp. tf2-5]SFO78233.1 Signal transduction histidine kinase [Prevotella sp. tf2-5]